MKGVPLIAFDVGGVGEMLDYSQHEDVIVMDSSAASLARKLQGTKLSLVFFPSRKAMTLQAQEGCVYSSAGRQRVASG